MNTDFRILHLEDDPWDARLIREYLRSAGVTAEITVAGTREAFEALLPQGFDVILADYHIPRVGGLEALGLARSLDPHIPFILVTGALGDERAVELLRSGATDFVLKDRLGRLASAIERAVFERGARRQQEQMQLRLAQAQRLSRMAAQAARMGTWQIHVASGRIECSDEFLDLLGIERSAWKGTLAALEALMPPEDVERLRRAHLDAVKGDAFMNTEFRIHDIHGKVKWMQWRGDCTIGPDGVPQHWLGVMVDVTEHKQMEEALRASDRRKDEFLATLAHELRNPLAPVCNGLTLLHRMGPFPAEIASIHAMVDRQVKHIVRLVDDLMDISRITLGKIDLRRAPIDLAQVVHNAVEMNRSAIESYRQRLEISIPPDITIDADPVRLTQVLSNLLNNASKYTGDAGKIRLTASVDRDCVVIRVRDTGVGIASALLPHVFDLFTQGDKAEPRGTAGLGIGLAMVRLLVEMHGGAVGVQSAGPGQGSEFTVRLPLMASPAGSERAPAFAAGQADSVEGMHVLVVDDNRDAADTLRMLLTLVGAEARVAYDGHGALDTLASYEADVVVLDIGMPEMDGYTVAKRIRQTPGDRKPVLIALTGRGQEQDRARSKAEGFDYHLAKPTDFNNLLALLCALKPRFKGHAVIELDP